MRIPLPLLVLMVLLLAGVPAARAQQAETPVDEDGSSQQTEQSDDSFRRSRELEDARARDRTYVDSTYTAQTELEKIDKLPEESRDNIRDQLVDIIVEDGEWEPKDALKEYPYEPTATAESDPELKEQEQEAWEEQIEKYHEREAAAWGSYSGPVPGPGNPSGQEGGQQGEQGEQGGAGGSGGGQGEGGGSGSAGTYQPGSSGSEDEVSTAGVSESALDFLKGRQQSSTQPGGQPQSSAQQAQEQQAQEQQAQEQQAQEQQAQEQQAREQQAREQQAQEQQAQEQQAQEQQAQEQQPDQQSSEQQQAAQESSEEQSEQQQESIEDINLDTRGIIAIKDLDKLEGATVPEEDRENDQ